ncbi:MAG TPA: choice-of-anchor Q domain-containing protein [Puia sp.]|nr:choice-of-anchor Q domain-containing protein [Puia sp.]
MNKSFLLISTFIIFIFSSCKRDSFITGSNATINFSIDTVYFDTVFTSTGSVTQSVKIFNPNNGKILLKDVKLMGGTNSVFKINVDGNNTTDAGNIEIAPNDSIYVFISVLVNINNSTLPFVLQDSILVSYNGNQKFIQLQAYGQNAHFLKNDEIKSDTAWANDLPFVILGGLQIDSGYSLTIKNGCRIYFHANAPLIVDGSLQVQGTDSSKVYFSGDRLDEPYKDFPASWPGIYFRESSQDNALQFAVIKNAYQGVVTENLSVTGNPKLKLDDCIIDNVYDAGILGIQTDIAVQNCLISNCGKNIVLNYGGNYSFINCTVAGYSNDYISHTSPVLSINNYTIGPSGNLTADINANFLNCIFWGSTGGVDNEVVTSKQGANTFAVNFSNCLWRISNTPANITSSYMLNADPMFDSVNNQKRFYNFHLKPSSPAIDYGAPTGIPFDLDGNPRLIGNATDLGCYEMQQ